MTNCSMKRSVNILSGVSLTPGWATEQQGHLTVSHGLLGEIVVDDDGVHAIVSEILAYPFLSANAYLRRRGAISAVQTRLTHRATSERRHVLQRSYGEQSVNV